MDFSSAELGGIPRHWLFLCKRNNLPLSVEVQYRYVLRRIIKKKVKSLPCFSLSSLCELPGKKRHKIETVPGSLDKSRRKKDATFCSTIDRIRTRHRLRLWCILQFFDGDCKPYLNKALAPQ
jgi:hypothetical protein